MLSTMAKFGVRPEKEDRLHERMKELGIIEEDIKETFIRSGGPGGQSVNKTATCVQIKHIPTGIVVKSQEGRSQGLNRFLARRLLVSRIEKSLLGKESPEQKRIERIRKQKQRRKRRTKKRLELSSNIQ
jgi:protein subunit release factor B